MSEGDEAQLRQELADCCRILGRLGLADYMGHPSVRLPGTDHVLIKPRHSLRIRAMDRVGPEQMVVIDLDGNFIRGDDLPPSERFIHTSIYRARPEVRAIVHTHQPMATIMGVASAPILPILHVQSPLVEESVPIWPHAQLVTDTAMGDDLAQTLGTHTVALLQGHGMVAVADGLKEATVHAIHLEQLAEANYRVLAINKPPRVIPQDEIRMLKERGVDWTVRWSYYAELAGVDLPS
jgi:ribulose-5-phosphate 4-epimerase/fuculose-1-phosphate aldolase